MPDKYITLRISLDDTNPEVWREVVVLDSITFHTLHEIIQLAMGWFDIHLYNFDIDEETQLTIPYDEDSFNMMSGLDASKHRLKHHIFRTKQKFHYEYDFGDSWDHTIQVIKITPIHNKPLNTAFFLAGANACPPEDCGGVYCP